MKPKLPLSRREFYLLTAFMFLVSVAIAVAGCWLLFSDNGPFGFIAGAGVIAVAVNFFLSIRRDFIRSPYRRK